VGLSFVLDAPADAGALLDLLTALDLDTRAP
jgi:hypothetical protein